MRTARETFCAALLATIALALLASAAPAGNTPQSQQPEKPVMQGKMPPDCQSMMAQRQKMMEEMKAMDARLDSLVQTMNGATGPAKVDATAAVVAELVAQRRTARERMSGMQAGMMQHMMEHMQAGGAQGMSQCPMMKEMGGAMKH